MPPRINEPRRSIDCDPTKATSAHRDRIEAAVVQRVDADEQIAAVAQRRIVDDADDSLRLDAVGAVDDERAIARQMARRRAR